MKKTTASTASTAPIKADPLAAARRYARSAKSLNTRRAYRSDWQDWQTWCAVAHANPMPASAAAVAAYIAFLADGGLAVATIERRLVTLAQAHKAAGHDTPTSSLLVHETLAGIRRTLGVAPSQKAPVLLDELRRMVAATPTEGLIGVRDRAILLAGFAGAFRRGELAGLMLSDIQWQAEGVVLRLRRSKTNQEGQAETVSLPYGRHAETCAVTALRRWVDAAALTAGPLFRAMDRHGTVKPHGMTGEAIAEVVKRAAGRAGLDPALYAGHSLRAGLVTSAKDAGIDDSTIMEQTRHRSVAMLRRYDRRTSRFRHNVLGKLDL